MHPSQSFRRSALPMLILSLATPGLGCAHEPPATRVEAAATLAPSSPAGRPEEALLNDGRRWTQAFYEGRTQEMCDHMSAPLRAHMGDKAGVDAFRDQVLAQLGPESNVLEERTEVVRGVLAYVRVARFGRVATPVRVVFGLDGDGRIALFSVMPDHPVASEAPTDKLDYVTHTALRLPFEGAWTVAWGGRTLAQNQHAATRDQRFAYDFLVRKDGATHAGDGTRNGDYYAYGRSVLAPADGRVVAAVDGVPENVPGQMDAVHPGGNYVVIDHGGGEFSFLAHLQPGSLTVHEGDLVLGGRVVGLCGNSGHSSEPHLHYHLQNSPKFFAGEGLPAPLVDYVADGKPVARGEATRGQVVEPAPRREVPHQGGEGS
jgi:murein DD-endopeptidase MepM/ murein hydrolase activator NlpD